MNFLSRLGAGLYIGGRLTDRDRLITSVQFWSLLLSVTPISLRWDTSTAFGYLRVVFITSTIADAFRTKAVSISPPTASRRTARAPRRLLRLAITQADLSGNRNYAGNPAGYGRSSVIDLPFTCIMPPLFRFGLYPKNKR